MSFQFKSQFNAVSRMDAHVEAQPPWTPWLCQNCHKHSLGKRWTLGTQYSIQCGDCVAEHLAQVIAIQDEMIEALKKEHRSCVFGITSALHEKTSAFDTKISLLEERRRIEIGWGSRYRSMGPTESEESLPQPFTPEPPPGPQPFTPGPNTQV